MMMVVIFPCEGRRPECGCAVCCLGVKAKLFVIDRISYFHDDVEFGVVSSHF